MKITPKLNQRFCKDNNIPINLFDEPYFTSRLELFNNQFNTLEKYEQFQETLNKFDNEQDYFEAYNKLKDEIINYLAESEGMQRFKEEDMNKYKVKNEGFPKNDIFKQNFDGRNFISIDMKKANYTALRHYDPSIVGNTKTYEEFMGMFTEEKHFINSKYIRQVVFGNQNPKRQTNYEKYLMDQVLTDILKYVSKETVVYYGTDEIVLDITELMYPESITNIVIPEIVESNKNKGIILKQEVFQLRHIQGTEGYIKKFTNKDGYEFKCLDALTMPFVLRAYMGEEVQEDDKVFKYEGKLAKLIEVPVIEVV